MTSPQHKHTLRQMLCDRSSFTKKCHFSTWSHLLSRSCCCEERNSRFCESWSDGWVGPKKFCSFMKAFSLEKWKVGWKGFPTIHTHTHTDLTHTYHKVRPTHLFRKAHAPQSTFRKWKYFTHMIVNFTVKRFRRKSQWGFNLFWRCSLGTLLTLCSAEARCKLTHIGRLLG